MKPMMHQEKGSVALAEMTALNGNHQTEIERENMIWTGSGKDIGIGTEIEVMISKVKGGGIGNVKKVEVEKGMIMRGTKAEKETEIEGGGQNESVDVGTSTMSWLGNQVRSRSFYFIWSCFGRCVRIF